MKLKLSALAVIACGALAVAGTALAGGGPASTKVTIKATNNGDFHGTVSSEKPKKCAKNRKITVYEKEGAHPDPKNDRKVNSDDASLQNGKYRWDTGNTGEGPGKYYARAKKIEGCKADNSKVVEVD